MIGLGLAVAGIGCHASPAPAEPVIEPASIATVATLDLTAGSLLIDASDDPSWNGWLDDGASEGGHVPGSVHLPVEWLTTSKLDLLSRGVTPDRSIVVGASDPRRAEATARRLASLGYPSVSVLGAPLHEAARSAGLSLERAARWQALVPPRWVHEVVEGRAPRTYPGRGFAVLEVGWGEPASREHVPGAAYFDTNLIERAPLWSFVPDAELKAVFERFGITRDTTVVLYGQPQMAAARVAVALLYAGVDDVRLMDGGWPAWTAAELPVATGLRTPTSVADFGAEVPGRPDLVVSRDEVRRMIDDADAAIVCTRSRAEHLGELSGYDSITARGRIRGSVWGNAGSDKDSVEQLEDPDGTLRGTDELRAVWATFGVGPERCVVFYCGTGWRASLALFHAYVMGWDRAALYDPGWFEWGADPGNNPIDAGPPR